MKDEISKIIAKNMPAQVGEELQKLLKEGESKKELLDIQIEVNARQTKIMAELREDNTRLLALKNSRKDLDLVKEKLEEKGRNLKLDILEIKLAEAEKRADVVTGFTNSLMRNTIARKSIIDSFTDGQPVVDGQGFTQYPIPTTKSLLETKEDD